MPIYGPTGNRLMPSTVTFVRGMFNSTSGAFRYLGGFVNPMTRDVYKLQPHDVQPKPRKLGLAPKSPEGEILASFANERLRASAASVAHGELPALAWRIQVGEKSVVFSGDTNGEGHLAKLAAGADLLVAHNAVPEAAQGAERSLHMPPSTIGRIAKDANVKQLVLSHRMRRTVGANRKRSSRSVAITPDRRYSPTTSTALRRKPRAGRQYFRAAPSARGEAPSVGSSPTVCRGPSLSYSRSRIARNPNIYHGQTALFRRPR